MKKCMKGWDDEVFNKSGDCCCNCKFFKKLYKHPWSEGLFKGSCSEQVIISNVPVNLCMVNESNIIAMTRNHSMCEMHTREDVTTSTK